MRPLTVVLTLAALAAVKLLTAWILYDPIEVWLHWDDYCRAVMSYHWSLAPYWYPSDVHWLPLQFYVYGLASGGEADGLQERFVVVSEIISTLTLFTMYGLGQQVYSRRVGLFAAGLYTFTAWQIVMGYSGLAEPLFHLTALAAIWAFVAWWQSERTGTLVAWAALMALAMLARYEGWILAALFTTCGAYRLWRGRRPKSMTVLTAILLLSPWLVPAWWILINLRVHGTPLQFLHANRQSFLESLWWMPPALRAIWYPFILVGLSPLLSGLLIWTGLTGRKRELAPAKLLVGIALVHLAILTAMYTRGNGPAFVDRIVLLHLYMLIPFGAARLASWMRSPRRNLRYLAVGFALTFAGSELYRAHAMLAEGKDNDYHAVGEDFEALSAYLREHWDPADGDVAVQCEDYGFFIGVRSGMPDQIMAVNAENVRDVLARRPVTLLCVPIVGRGHWRPDPRIEPVSRERRADNSIKVEELGNWRLLRVLDEQHSPASRSLPGP